MRTAIAALFLFSFSLSAQVADVRLVGQTSRPTTLPPGDFGSITVAVQNLGPDAARNLRVEYKASPGVRFTKILDQHCAASSAEAVLCTYGDFAPGVTYSGADYDMPFVAGTHTVTATILTDSSDPDPANNSYTLTYEVVRAAGVFVLAFPHEVRVDPGETATIRTAVLREPRARETDTIPAGTVVDARLSVTNGATIEAIDAPSIWNCTFGGATAACRAIAPGGDCCGELNVKVRASQDRTGGVVRLDAEAVVQRPSLDLPSTDAASIEVFRHAVVTNVQDDGPGSLRAAIGEVNAHCAPQSCRLLFEIPAGGALTIEPATPLPPIVADRILVDGAGAVLDGHLAGKGLEVHAACEATVRGFTFRSFTANEGLWFTAGHPCDNRSPWPRQFRIEDNRFERNRRGLILDGAPFPIVTRNVFRDNQFSGIWMWRGSAWIEFNTIQDNGASGIFLGPAVQNARVLSNTIAGHREMGVAVAYGASLIEIGSNRMRGNGGLGIDWGLDGPTQPRDDDSTTETNAPTVLSAVYDPAANRTQVTVAVRTRRMATFPNSYTVIELFANDGPDGDGETPIRLESAPQTDGTPFTIAVPGDHRGKWINATATRAVSISPAAGGSVTTNTAGDLATTSELSNAVLVSP